MGINQAEDRPESALVAELRRLRREFDEYRSRPQQIGNGSINYAVFTEFNAGPFTVPSSLTANYALTFAPISLPFYYDGREAINKATLESLRWSVKVDVNDYDHAVPYGAALVGPERSPITNQRIDYYNSGMSDTNGQMYVIMQITNNDTVTHTYWITGSMLIPRPALKPQ
ncbi:hypothetical protein [Mycolicibacterium porcinum]|uniref:hypothetical protein n=1 Tax=Mycolicibacterium porcinum TaxID=39693 RepID=UPI0010422951|nr:hypothetical protein [Mycolicibacterium porcinum]